MSYRDTHSESKLTQLTEGLLNKEVLLWSIKLGPIEKESVDALVSETLVSLSYRVLHSCHMFQFCQH